jgi:hypothetical protein
MKRWLLLVAACRSAPPPSPLAGMDVSVTTVEWRIVPTDGDHVDVKLVVDGMVNPLGSVAATPETCAIRSAAAKLTEMLCGDATFVATVEPGELVVTRDDREAKRIPIGPSVAISVAPYRMPVTPVTPVTPETPVAPTSP